MIKDFIQLVLKPMATVSIGSRTYSGRNIQINGNVVFVDGVRQNDSLVAPVFITVTGDVERIKGGATRVNITGNCKTVETMSGDVTCGDVTGDVETMSGAVHCKVVFGDVETMSGKISFR